MKAVFASIFLSLLVSFASAQSCYFTKGHFSYSLLDRLEIKYPTDNNFHSSIKHYYRKNAADYINDLDSLQMTFNTSTHADLEYLHRELKAYSKREFQDFNTKEKSILRHFYNSKAHFYELKKPNFQLVLNPIVNIKLGKEKDRDETIFQNTRGLELRAQIDNKIYFYSAIYENQANFLNFIERRINHRQSIPAQGFYKTFQSGIFDSFTGYDYLNAEAYFGLPISESVGIELGHSNHFIGNGYRSLLLSDYANNYFYLKLYLNVWKLHYQSIFAELAPISSVLNSNNTLLSKKYMASHYLSLKTSKRFEIGLFESVVFSRENHFEFQYLNPVILYRTVEQFLDSPDNVIIGINGKWNVVNDISLYGQMVLDEFKLSELSSNNGWWGNKYGFQAGIKYIDVAGIDHLDLQFELNMVRPFTYSHRDTVKGFANYSLANYSHYGQELAHPLGANFYESIFKLRYTPFEKVILDTKLQYAIKGDNAEDYNYGGDIFLPVETRQDDYGFLLTSGVDRKIINLSMNLSYHLFHNYFIELNYLYRKSDSENDIHDLNTQYIGIGFRMNVANYKIDY